MFQANLLQATAEAKASAAEAEPGEGAVAGDSVRFSGSCLGHQHLASYVSPSIECESLGEVADPTVTVLGPLASMFRPVCGSGDGWLMTLGQQLSTSVLDC